MQGVGGGLHRKRKAVTKLGDLSGSGTIFDSLPLPKLKGHFAKFTELKRNNAIIKLCTSAAFNSTECTDCYLSGRISGHLRIWLDETQQSVTILCTNIALTVRETALLTSILSFNNAVRSHTGEGATITHGHSNKHSHPMTLTCMCP